jgi:hypothetical protein
MIKPRQYGIILVSAVAPLGVMLVLASNGHANPYIEGYGYNGTKIYHADTSWYLTKFVKSCTSCQPLYDLLSVLTEAGSTSSSGTGGESGVFYQTVSQWEASDQHIYANDQVFIPAYKSTNSWNDYKILCPSCDQAHLNRITGNPVWINSHTQVNFTHTYIFKNGTHVHVSSIYSPKPPYDISTYFLIGQCTGSTQCGVSVGSNTVGFDQFAAETDTSQTGGFDIQQSLLQFNDKYDYGISTQIDLGNMNANLVQENAAINGWFTDQYGNFQLEYPGDTYFNNLEGYGHHQVSTISPGGVWWNTTSCTGNYCQNSFTPLWP